MAAAKKPVGKGVGKGAAVKSKAPIPPVITDDVVAVAVDELPEQGYSRTERAMRYATVLHKVRVEVGAGKWVPIATFAGRGGAVIVKKAIEDGKRAIDGEVTDWMLEARKNDVGGSVLWAQLRAGGGKVAKK